MEQMKKDWKGKTKQESAHITQGISLIVLVITIIVIIIIAGAVILTINNNNPMSNASKARFQSDMRSFQEELNLYILEQATQTSGTFEAEQLNANMSGIIYTGKGSIDTTGTIVNIVKSIQGTKYQNIIAVVKGQLTYQGVAKEELEWASALGILVDVQANGVNSPATSMLEGMIPVWYDEQQKEWKKADILNLDMANPWYNYNSSAKRWANVVTITPAKRSMYMGANVGTKIAMEDITTMFVWIPRYAYSIQENGYKKVATNAQNKVAIKFLVGDTNQDIDSKTYALDYDSSKVKAGQDTPYIVHPAFHFGDQEVKGIWVAKFEASASPNSNGNYPGNKYKSSTANSVGGYPYLLESKTSSTRLQVIPNVPSWREITISDMFQQCTKMQRTDAAYYGWTASNAHMMKNTEWGAVAYLSASLFGNIPSINAASQTVTWIDSKNANGTENKLRAITNMIAGAGRNSDGTDKVYTFDGSTAYQTSIGKASSTTGNVYGVYDMAGGASEYLAAYLDNNNSMVTQQGAVMISSDAKYADVYAASSEEKNDVIQDTVSGGTITQNDLWNKTKAENGVERYNEIRYRLTNAIYDLMKNKKGDAGYEIIENGNVSYYGKTVYQEEGTGADKFSSFWLKGYPSNTYDVAKNWSNGMTSIGNLKFPFVRRGGSADSGVTGSIFTSDTHYGYAYEYIGFRPVISGQGI